MTKAIAIDLGGTHASIAIVANDTLLATTHIEIKATHGLASLLPQLQTAVTDLLASCSTRTTDCIGLSLSLPSLVDFRRGKIVSCNDKYPDATELDLQAWSRTTFDLLLAVENDARAALIGEHYCGAAQGIADVLMLTFGTGIGSALLVGGKPFRTRQAQGGNLGGHIPVSLHGRPCTCGAIGCMEAEASSWALPLIIRDWPGIEASSLFDHPHLNFELLFDLASEGDTIAQSIAAHCIHVWSVGTVGLIHAYGPELVIFGGGVMKSATQILPPLRQYVHQHAWAPSGPVTLSPASLGNDAALYAAVPLLQEFLKGNA
ncbi:ROK family protein [Granulicella arctica]|uniref:ROK family protein n=1 Tax=Granulicella arctica TaxID=940613 RepID=UPI0021E025C9|nr:ROK family protein [Granulicella arctica]